MSLLDTVVSLWRRPVRDSRPHILVIDDWFPDARIGAGAPRAMELLRAVASVDAQVTLLPTRTDPGRDDDVSAQVPGLTVACGYGERKMKRFLSRYRGHFDLVIISRPHNMAAFRAAVASRPDIVGVTPVIYDAEALYIDREVLRLRILGAPLSAAEARRQFEDELALAQGTHAIFAVNEQTARSFREAGHADVRLLGHALVPQPTTADFAARDGFLFVGPAYADGTPNADSIVWFIDRALPILREAMARDVPFVIAGVSASPAVTARAKGGVQITGPLADLTDAYARARVFVAPTRFAAGIPFKVHEAAARGVPIVLTPLLAEQIGWTHECEVLIAETPEDFAAQCQRLHSDKTLWNRLRERALARVAQDCDPQLFRTTVTTTIAQVMACGDMRTAV